MNTPLHSQEDSGATQSNHSEASEPDVVKSVTSTHSKRIDLAFHGQPHWFSVRVIETEERLIETLRSVGVLGRGSVIPDDAIAFTDTWSNAESLENGVGDKDCAGHMYFVDTSLSTIAHEATHMALGILSRSGISNLAVVTADANEDEEKLCSVVGFITEEVVTALNDLVATNSNANTDLSNPPKGALKEQNHE